MTPDAAGAAARQQRSDYSDVAAMFCELADYRAGTRQFQRLREAIVQRCLPLADHVAYRFVGRGESSEDLTQVARVGLLNAVNRFDIEAGSDFAAFAVPTIMGEVRRHFRDNSWSVKVPRRLKDLQARITAVSGELSQRLGRAPNASELAEHIDVDRMEVVEALVARNSYNTLSLDVGTSGDGDDEARPIAETLGGADFRFDQIENREVLRPLLAALPERERTVLLLRFFESMTQSQIAERIGVSQMHVWRLLAKSLERLRDRLG